MKKIKLTNIYPGDKTSLLTDLKKNTIFLGDGYRFMFTDMKVANNFLAETNRFINNKMAEINEAYITVFTEFRRLWYDLSRSDTRSVRAILNQVDKEIELIFSRYDNPNFLILKKIIVIFDLLNDALEFFIDKYKKSNNWSFAHRLEGIVKYYLSLKYDVKNYGKDSEYRHTGPVGLRMSGGRYADV